MGGGEWCSHSLNHVTRGLDLIRSHIQLVEMEKSQVLLLYYLGSVIVVQFGSNQSVSDCGQVLPIQEWSQLVYQPELVKKNIPGYCYCLDIQESCRVQERSQAANVHL